MRHNRRRQEHRLRHRAEVRRAGRESRSDRHRSARHGIREVARGQGLRRKGVHPQHHQPRRCARVFADIVQTMGDIYALVNNAGVVDVRPFEENDEAILDKMFKVNVYGTTYCIQALPSMKKNHGGKIINFASKSGKTGPASWRRTARQRAR
ncbi:MAG: SDR family oxidoreductase [Eubacteriales bacterium]